MVDHSGGFDDLCRALEQIGRWKQAHEGVRNEHKVAWLIGAAIDGYLDIQGDRRHPTLVRRAAASTSQVDESTLTLLDHAFGGREHLTLGAHDARFAEAWNALGDRLSGWQRTSGLRDPTGDHRRKRAQELGIILAPLGLVLAFLGGILAGWWDWDWQVIVMTGAVLAAPAWPRGSVPGSCGPAPPPALACGNGWSPFDGSWPNPGHTRPTKRPSAGVASSPIAVVSGRIGVVLCAIA